MYIDDYAPKLKSKPRRLDLIDRPPFVRRILSRFIAAAETAALLEVTEDLLIRWHVTSHRPQPVPRPEGRLYRAEPIERLAAMPRLERMLAISLRRY